MFLSELTELYFYFKIVPIFRDKSRFSGLAFLQACLGLCYFHRLPEILVKLTFSVEFLEKLDEELSNCYAKVSKPISKI